MIYLSQSQVWFLFPLHHHHQKGSGMGRGSVVIYVGAQEEPVRETIVAMGGMS